MRAHRSFIAAVALLVGLVALASTASAQTHSAWTKATVAIPIAPGATNPGYGTGGEPRMIVAPDGTTLLSAHYQTWDCTTRTPNAAKHETCVWSAGPDGVFTNIGGDPSGGSSDDVDLAVTTNGVLLESYLANKGLGNGVGGTTLARSTDGGQTWQEVVVPNKQVVNDRPWLLVAPNGDVLLFYIAIPGGIWVARSTDDGATWDVPTMVVPPTSNGGINALGAPTVDQARGDIVVPYASSDQQACTGISEGCWNLVHVMRSHDSGTTWTDETVADLGQGSGYTSMESVAADAQGGEYLVGGVADGYTPTTGAIGHIHVLVMRLMPGATTWLPPLQVDTSGAAMLPAIAAGAGGQVAVGYYASTYSDAQSQMRPWSFVGALSKDYGKSWSRTTLSPVAYVGDGLNHQTTLWDISAAAYGRDGIARLAWADTDGGDSTATTVIRYAQTTGKGNA